jgi:hypothetical protein
MSVENCESACSDKNQRKGQRANLPKSSFAEPRLHFPGPPHPLVAALAACDVRFAVLPSQ